jgi:hypothetical protein
MISSLASVLVANANATPENVVPYHRKVSGSASASKERIFIQNQCRQSAALSIYRLLQPLLDGYTDSYYAALRPVADAVSIQHNQVVGVEPLECLEQEIVEWYR